MKLIALVIGLILEHVATQLLHLRELRWFDKYYDFCLARLKQAQGAWVYAGIAAILLAPAAPVLVVSYALQSPGLWDPDYLAFAVLVVFFLESTRFLAPLIPGLSAVQAAAVRELAIAVALLVILRFYAKGLLPERIQPPALAASGAAPAASRN